jgi:hypothetical protein
MYLNIPFQEMVIASTTKLSGLGLKRQMSPVCNSNWWQTYLSGGAPISECLLDKLLVVTPIPYSLEHGIEIMHPVIDSDCLVYVSLSTLSGDCRIAT